jgi:hypothetical protein
MESEAVLVILGLVAFVAFKAGRIRRRRQPRVWRENHAYGRGAASKGTDEATVAKVIPPVTTPTVSVRQNMADPRTQMEAVSRVGFQPVPLLNRSEARLLPLLESVVRSAKSGHRVMAQTALGEVIRPLQDGVSKELQDQAFASINSKRLDFAIIDRFGILRLAIEYQGHGHYHDTSFMRDVVKREALRKAGVPFLEISADYRRDDVIREVCRVLNIPDNLQDRDAAATAH